MLSGILFIFDYNGSINKNVIEQEHLSWFKFLSAHFLQYTCTDLILFYRNLMIECN